MPVPISLLDLRKEFELVCYRRIPASRRQANRYVGEKLHVPNQPLLTGRAVQCDNTAEGFTELDRWLRHQGARPTETMLCMEQTGVYGYRLLAAMTDLGWWCAVEKTTIGDAQFYERFGAVVLAIRHHGNCARKNSTKFASPAEIPYF